MASWLARRYTNPKVQGANPGLDRNAYFHGVKTRLSTLGTGDVPIGSRVYTTNVRILHFFKKIIAHKNSFQVFNRLNIYF